MKPITPTLRQQQVLDYMQKFFEMNDQLPTIQAITDAFGWASTNAADSILIRIERAGYLQRNELGNRMFARGEQS